MSNQLKTAEEMFKAKLIAENPYKLNETELAEAIEELDELMKGELKPMIELAYAFASQAIEYTLDKAADEVEATFDQLAILSLKEQIKSDLKIK